MYECKRHPYRLVPDQGACCKESLQEYLGSGLLKQRHRGLLDREKPPRSNGDRCTALIAVVRGNSTRTMPVCTTKGVQSNHPDG